jgi:hypothetical protein
MRKLVLSSSRRNYISERTESIIQVPAYNFGFAHIEMSLPQSIGKGQEVSYSIAYFAFESLTTLVATHYNETG